MIYYGEYYVRRKGLVIAHLQPAEVRRLIESAKHINYFTLKSEYGYNETDGCDAVAADAPIVTTSVTAGDQSHGIIHHHRCESPIPNQVTAFENEIEKAVHVEQYTK